jgi:hypothetical protein
VLGEKEDSGFKVLRKRSHSKETIKNIRDKIFELEDLDRRSLYSISKKLRGRIKDSLLCEEVNNVELWDKINSCGYGREKKCGSFWCKRCRDVVSRMFESKVRHNIDSYRDWLGMEVGNNDFNMLTGVLGLNRLDSNEIVDSIVSDKNRWKRIKRRMDKIGRPIFIVSVYEFELVNGLFLMNSVGRDNEFKKKMVRQLVDRDSSNRFRLNDVFVFSHFHSISNLTEYELKEVCKKDFYMNGSKLNKMNDCGLYLRNFIKDREIDKNLKTLTNYPFKDVYRFKYTFKGSDHTNGEYLNKEELGNLISLYDGLSGRGYRRLFREVSNYDRFNIA